MLAAALCALTAPTPAPAAPDGSGVSAWRTGPAGLPAYRYTLDEERDARARQPELAGRPTPGTRSATTTSSPTPTTTARSSCWSQDRRFQWVNRRDGASGHFGGGYGYCGQAGARSAPATTTGRRARGRCATSASARSTGGVRMAGLDVDEVVYAPFGDDPLLLDDVNDRQHEPAHPARELVRVLDVNPYDQQTKHPAAWRSALGPRPRDADRRPEPAPGPDGGLTPPPRWTAVP